MRFVAAVLTLAALALPSLAGAQDPIGALLAGPASASQADPEEPDTAAEPPAAPEAEPQIALPANAAPPAATPPRLTEPVFVDETGKTPDVPPTVRDLAYESRLRASFASAQAFQGPLDGRWTLVSADGTGLYEFELADRTSGAPEGAWRDLRRPGALGASGFVDQIRHDGGQLTLQFAGMTGTFNGGYAGQWTGQLSDGQSVSLRKAPPQP